MATRLRARLQLALGAARGVAERAARVYVTLAGSRRAGLLRSEQVERQSMRPDRKVYTLSEAGQARVREWLADTSWSKPAPAEFHLKLVAAAAAGLADPACGWSTRNGTRCWRPSPRRSPRRCSRRMSRSQGFYSRVSCCGYKRTCAGSRRVHVSGARKEAADGQRAGSIAERARACAGSTARAPRSCGPSTVSTSMSARVRRWR